MTSIARALLPQYTPTAAPIRAITEPRPNLVGVSLLGDSPAPPNAAWMLQLSLFSFDAAFVFIDISAPLSKSTDLISANELEAPQDRCREQFAHTRKCWRVRFDFRSERKRLTGDPVGNPRTPVPARCF
jgi:hypothetical protein